MSTFTNDDLIFENYSDFVSEHRSDIDTPQSAMELLASNSGFENYISKLTEGLSDSAASSVQKVCARQREIILTESVNISQSPAAIGYAVTYFPILTDIYSDPVITQVATTHTTNKPLITIPRINITGTVKNIDNTVSKYNLPRPNFLARANRSTVALTEDISNDIFTLAGAGANSASMRMNRRYFSITEVTLSDVTNPLPVTFRPDARGQISEEFEYTDTANVVQTATIVGNVNWDKATFLYSLTSTSGPAITSSMSADVILSPKSTDVGRVKVKVEQSGFDIDIDVRDDFEIELQTESIQDYRDIYNVDLIKTMSQAIKQQILLNKDWDLAYYLGLYESKMADLGSSRILDLAQYQVSGNEFRPANVVDIFKSVIPKITSVCRNIHTQFRAEPQFLLAGNDTASILESLQAFCVHSADAQHGEAGFKSDSIGFAKKTILHSSAIPDDKIYIIYKAPGDNLARTAIADLVYQPLYIVEETTYSQHRTYIKTRTALEITAVEALGVITLQNHAQWVTS